MTKLKYQHGEISIKNDGAQEQVRLYSPDINTPDIDGGTIDGAVIGGLRFW